MLQIKSEKAKDFIMSIAEPTPTPNGELVFYVEMTPLQVVEAISIAEAEAEERHAAELQALKDKAAEAFCYSMNIGFACKKDCPAGKCTGFNNFTQKLNEK